MTGETFSSSLVFERSGGLGRDLERELCRFVLVVLERRSWKESKYLPQRKGDSKEPKWVVKWLENVQNNDKEHSPT